jgi:hypothetical protein
MIEGNIRPTTLSVDSWHQSYIEQQPWSLIQLLFIPYQVAWDSCDCLTTLSFHFFTELNSNYSRSMTEAIEENKQRHWAQVVNNLPLGRIVRKNTNSIPGGTGFTYLAAEL